MTLFKVSNTSRPAKKTNGLERKRQSKSHAPGYSWARQRIAKANPIPSRREIIATADSILDPRVRAFFVISYLTGGRIQEVLGIKRKDIDFGSKKNRQLFLITMINEKNKKRRYKQIPIPIDKKFNRILLSKITDYIDGLQDNDFIFPVSQRWARKLLERYVPYNPHFIRDIRLSHLVMHNDFGDWQLVKFAGWTDSRPAQHYINLRWSDMLGNL